MKLVLFVCLIGVVFALNPKDEAGVNKITKSSGCGNKDLTQPDEIVKNYQIGSRKWANPNISYFLNNVPQNLKRKDLIEQIKKSFDIYAKVSHLNFFEADGPVSVDISIGFYRGEHGDSNPFGPDRNPAHTYPPGSTEISGDIHFNLDITWSIGPTEKPKENLSNHLMREIGYALGLMQSSAQGSIMNPHYFDTLTKNQKTITYLGKDDILGLEKLYAIGVDGYFHSVDKTVAAHYGEDYNYLPNLTYYFTEKEDISPIYRWIVAIYYKPHRLSEYYLWCTGALIKGYTVITSASCMKNEDNRKLRVTNILGAGVQLNHWYAEILYQYTTSEYNFKDILAIELSNVSRNWHNDPTINIDANIWAELASKRVVCQVFGYGQTLSTSTKDTGKKFFQNRENFTMTFVVVKLMDTCPEALTGELCIVQIDNRKDNFLCYPHIGGPLVCHRTVIGIYSGLGNELCTQKRVRITLIGGTNKKTNTVDKNPHKGGPGGPKKINTADIPPNRDDLVLYRDGFRDEYDDEQYPADVAFDSSGIYYPSIFIHALTIAYNLHQ